MENNGIIAQVCSLPEQLDRAGDKTLVQLLKELNVNRKNFTIGIKDIEDYLKDNSDLVESWLLYSMNKRTSKGWYFIKKNKTKYVVGYLSKDATDKNELAYPDSAQACATFIHNELFENAR